MTASPSWEIASVDTSAASQVPAVTSTPPGRVLALRSSTGERALALEFHLRQDDSGGSTPPGRILIVIVDTSLAPEDRHALALVVQALGAEHSYLALARGTGGAQQDAAVAIESVPITLSAEFLAQYRLESLAPPDTGIARGPTHLREGAENLQARVKWFSKRSS